MGGMSKTSIRKFSGKQWAAVVVVLAVVLFGVSGWGWWHSVRSNPKRTLYATIENNLRTPSVTRQVRQQSGAQKLEQDVEVSLSPQAAAHGHTSISQTGQVNATVKTETISTPKDEFVQYASITTDQKNASGKTLDFSKAMGMWGKSSMEGTGQTGQLFGESLLGVVLTANLQPHDRRALMKTIREKNVYEYDESKVERKIVNGRPVYRYAITVKPTNYVQMLKQFGKYVGLEQLEGLDPQQFATSPPLEFTMEVDVWSQHMTVLHFQDSAQQSSELGRTEKLTGYGISHTIDIPKKSVSVEELQATLQQAQQ
jgi:hypothetical protein